MFPEITSRIRDLFAPPGSLSITNPNAGEPSEGKDYSYNSGNLEALTTEWYWRNGYFNIANALGAGAGALMVRVSASTLHSAMNHSVVWACNRIISETVGFIPLVMLQAERAEGVKEPRARSTRCFRRFKNAPNDEMTAMGFRETLTSHCVLQGNAYAQIIRRSGTGVAMELQPAAAEPGPRPGGTEASQLVYVVKDGQRAGEDVTQSCQQNKPQDILHIRGIGYDGTVAASRSSRWRASRSGPRSRPRRTWATSSPAAAGCRTSSRWRRSSKRTEDFDRFRADWETDLRGRRTKRRSSKTTSSTSRSASARKDSQLLETRLFDIHEICRWFGVPPHLVGDLSRATFSNIEQLALEFVKLTLVSLAHALGAGTLALRPDAGRKRRRAISGSTT